MINRFILFFNIFKSRNFSILCDLGTLSKYKYNEMSLYLLKWDKSIINSIDFRDVTWQNKSTLIKIRYSNKTDEFIQILSEEWKFYNLKYIRNDL